MSKTSHFLIIVYLVQGHALPIENNNYEFDIKDLYYGNNNSTDRLDYINYNDPLILTTTYYVEKLDEHRTLTLDLAGDPESKDYNAENLNDNQESTIIYDAKFEYHFIVIFWICLSLVGIFVWYFTINEIE